MYFFSLLIPQDYRSPQESMLCNERDTCHKARGLDLCLETQLMHTLYAFLGGFLTREGTRFRNSSLQEVLFMKSQCCGSKEDAMSVYLCSRIADTAGPVSEGLCLTV